MKEKIGMAQLIKAALVGVAGVLLTFLLAGGFPLLQKQGADLVVFVSFLAGILIISYGLMRKRGREK